MDRHRLDQIAAKEPQSLKYLSKHGLPGLLEQDPLLYNSKFRPFFPVDMHAQDTLCKDTSSKISNRKIIEQNDDTRINPQYQRLDPKSFQSYPSEKNKISKPEKNRKLILNLAFELNQLKAQFERGSSEKNFMQTGRINKDLVESLKDIIQEETDSKYSLMREDVNRLYESKSKEVAELSKQLGIKIEETDRKYNLMREGIISFYDSKVKEIAELSNQLGIKKNEFNSRNRPTLACDASIKSQYSRIVNVQLSNLENEVAETRKTMQNEVAETRKTMQNEVAETRKTMQNEAALTQKTIVDINEKTMHLTQENLYLQERLNKLDSQVSKQQAENLYLQERVNKLDSQVSKQQADLNSKAKENIDMNFQLSRMNKELSSLKNDKFREAIISEGFFIFQQASQFSIQKIFKEISLLKNQQNMCRCEDLLYEQTERAIELDKKLEETLDIKFKELDFKFIDMFQKSKKGSKKQTTVHEKRLKIGKWKNITHNTINKYPDWHKNNLIRILDAYGEKNDQDNLLWKFYKQSNQVSEHIYKTPDIFSEYEKISWEWPQKELEDDEDAKEVILNYINEWSIIDPKTMYYINADCKKRFVQVLPGGKTFPYKVTRISYTGLDLLWWISLLKGIILKGNDLRELGPKSGINGKGICFSICHKPIGPFHKKGNIEDCYGNKGLEGIINRAKETISFKCTRRKINEKGKIVKKKRGNKIRVPSKSLIRFSETDEDFLSQIGIRKSFKSLSPIPKIIKRLKRISKIPRNLNPSEVSLILKVFSEKDEAGSLKDLKISKNQPSLSWRSGVINVNK